MAEVSFKPCPFCGSWDVGVVQINNKFIRGCCEDCGSFGPVRNTSEEAIAAWNNRTEITFGYYDKIEEFDNCTVQVLTNTETGDISVGWMKNSENKDSIPEKEVLKDDSIEKNLEKIGLDFSKNNINKTTEFLKNAIKKQVPLAPNGVTGVSFCPNCMAQLSSFTPYCTICGQKLDWSERDELLG